MRNWWKWFWVCRKDGHWLLTPSMALIGKWEEFRLFHVRCLTCGARWERTADEIQARYEKVEPETLYAP